MPKKLWEECLICKDKCCTWKISLPLFLNLNEKRNFPQENNCAPCKFFNEQNGLCSIHQTRPFDCRFFPFDILKINGKFFWIIWKVNCPILEKNREKFEFYLLEHERDLIPKFREDLNAYSKFRLEEFLSKYKYEILREVNFLQLEQTQNL